MPTQKDEVEIKESIKSGSKLDKSSIPLFPEVFHAKPYLFLVSDLAFDHKENFSFLSLSKLISSLYLLGQT